MLKSSRSTWLGFTWQLFLVTVLPLTVLVLAVAFGSQSLHHDAMRSLVGDRDLRAVRAAANSLEQEIMHRVFIVQMLGRELGSRTNFNGLSLSSTEVSAGFDGGIALFSSERDLILASQPAEFWASLKNTLPGYLDTISNQTGIPAFSPPLWITSEKKSFVLVGTQTEAHTFLLGAFTPTFLVQNTLESFVSSGQITALVINRVETASGYEVLYRTGPGRTDEHSAGHPGILESLNGESGINYFHGSGGEHVVAFTPIAPIGWGLVIEEAWEDIANPYLNTTQAAPLVVVPVFLLALVALWFGARRIVRPLQKLEKQAAELAKGNFTAIRTPVGGIREIRNLQFELMDMADRLKTAQQSLRSYIGAITAGVENERRSLARELHDDTIQSLIALNQRIQLATREAPGKATIDLDKLQVLVKQTMTNLRRMIRGLRPIYLEDLGLAASLEMLAQENRQISSIPTSFQVEGDERRLDSQTEMSLYRMVQESLSNIAHHSQAQQAWVELSFTPTDVTLEVRDNGKGFVVPAGPMDFPKMGHFGLLGLHERAEIIGAELRILSIPGQGTRVLVNLPVEPSNRASP